MATRYKMVRMPIDTYNHYCRIKTNMETDLAKTTGIPMKLPMTTVFNAVVNPKLNDNYIEVDLKKLAHFGKKIKRPII